MAWFEIDQRNPYLDLDVAIVRDPFRRRTFMVDSGAAFNLAPSAWWSGYAHAGPSVPSGMKDAQGHPIMGHMVTAQMRIIGRTWTTSVWLSPTAQFPLLGMEGFFNEFGVVVHNFPAVGQPPRFAVFDAQPMRRRGVRAPR